MIEFVLSRSSSDRIDTSDKKWALKFYKTQVSNSQIKGRKKSGGLFIILMFWTGFKMGNPIFAPNLRNKIE